MKTALAFEKGVEDVVDRLEAEKKTSYNEARRLLGRGVAALIRGRHVASHP